MVSEALEEGCPPQGLGTYFFAPFSGKSREGIIFAMISTPDCYDDRFAPERANGHILPVCPLERHYLGGKSEGVERGGLKQTLKRSKTFLGGPSSRKPLLIAILDARVFKRLRTSPGIVRFKCI